MDRYDAEIGMKVIHATHGTFGHIVGLATHSTKIIVEWDDASVSTEWPVELSPATNALEKEFSEIKSNLTDALTLIQKARDLANKHGYDLSYLSQENHLGDKLIDLAQEMESIQSAGWENSSRNC